MDAEAMIVGTLSSQLTYSLMPAEGRTELVPLGAADTTQVTVLAQSFDADTAPRPSTCKLKIEVSGSTTVEELAQLVSEQLAALPADADAPAAVQRMREGSSHVRLQSNHYGFSDPALSLSEYAIFRGHVFHAYPAGVPSEDTPFVLRCLRLNGEAVPLDVTGRTTVEEAKTMLEEAIGGEIRSLMLPWKNVLDDDTLYNYCCWDGCTAFFVTRT